MKTIEVADKWSRNEFLNLPFLIYKDDPNWVCPLLNDIESIFNPKKNNFFNFGKCTRWILVDETGKTIGRIAAFINDKKAFNEVVPTGGCGFFECIDNTAASTILFDQAKKWLQMHGMKAMNGPINFGENDMWWGLLVDGFTRPFFGMNYNPSYYKKHFEQYGFVVKYEQISNKVNCRNVLPEKVMKIANWVINKRGFSFKHFDYQHLNQFADDFKEIYNDAWKDFDNFTEVTDLTIQETLKKIKPIMDPKLIWFAYGKTGEPLAFVMILPDANELFYNLNGKLGLLGTLKFLWNKITIKHTRMRAVIMGTKEKYRNQGIESCLLMKLHEYTRPLVHYEELELSWVGDFNDKMLALHEAVGGVFAKKHTTYVYKFIDQ